MNPLILPSVLIAAYVATIGMSMSKDRYKFRVIASFISFLFGIIFEVCITKERRFIFLLFGLLPCLYLCYYELLRIILKPIIGKYPYTPYRDKIGAYIIGKGYPKNRKVSVVDYIFGFALLILPPITLVYLSFLLDDYF